MGARSEWFCTVGFVAALLASLALLSFTGTDARAQEPAAETGGQASGQSFKLAQTFYYPYYPQVKRKKRRRRRYRRRAVKKCASPWTYSRGLQRCICVAEGYGVSEEQCVKVAEICPKNAQWSDTEQKCQCQKGFVENGSQCVDPNAGVVTYNRKSVV